MADELTELAERAVAAAVDAGAGDAEAYLEDSRGLELRVYEGEVESLSESVSRGVGVRAWLDGRSGYAYGTDLTVGGTRRDRRRRGGRRADLRRRRELAARRPRR